MSITDAYDNHDALGLAALVRARQIHPGELLDEALRRVEQRNPRLNAVWSTFEARARAQIEAGVGNGVLAGVPYLLKDLHVHLAGEVTTNGSRFFADAVAPTTSTIVERYLAAGLVVFGKTATPELGVNVSTEPVLRGPTRNPWDTGRTAGGSSGGAGAAVAGGIVPAAHATDGGGSIRIPASCNGLFGLKPTRGRVPMGPVEGEAWNGLSIGHAVTRSVRDSAALLDAVAGGEPGDPYSAPPAPTGGFVAAMNEAPGRLRLGFTTTTGRDGVDVDPECVTAVERAVALLAELGHDVVEVRLPVDWATFLPAFGTVTSTHVASTVAERAAELGREPRADELESVVRAQIAAARARPAVAYVEAVKTIQRIGRTMGTFFQTVDGVVTPTLGAVPFPLGTVDANTDDVATFGARAGRVSQFLGIANATGQPAMSVPLHWTPDGLPVGVQVIGRFGAEATLLSLARQLEEASPWWHRTAPVGV